MWALIARTILRNRIAFLVTLGLITGLMAYEATTVKVFYGLPKLLPSDDPTHIDWDEFKARFNPESTVFVIGLEKDPLDDVKLFNAWLELGNKVAAQHGVDTVVSVAHIFNVEANSDKKRFDLVPITQSPVKSKAELDSIKSVIKSLPFYKGLIYTDSSSLMAISLNKELFNSEKRGALFTDVLEEVAAFEEEQNVSIRYSGMPYIRTVLTDMVKAELRMFIVLMVIVMVIILFFFFRSVKPVLISMVVVGLGVVWSLGIMGIMGYQITVLTSIIPPLVIVIGIPNCVFLINKFHAEYKNHQNKTKALTRVVQKIGKATFMTNATTAVGFLTFIFTQSDILVEFGIVASINIMLLFTISLIVITTVFSFVPPPKERHTKHIDRKWVNTAVSALVHIVNNYRNLVYGITITLVLVAIYAVTLIRTSGNMVDDLPYAHPVSEDLRYFEHHFNGVMPFEISIDSKRPRLAVQQSNLERLDSLQSLFAEYPQFSRPISIVEAIKFMYQGYNGGDPEKYTLIEGQDRITLKDYFDPDKAGEGAQVLDDFLDSNRQVTRVSYKMADIGTEQMDSLVEELKPRIDSIFNPDRKQIDSLYQLVLDAGESKKEAAIDAYFEAYPAVQRQVQEEFAFAPELAKALKEKPELLEGFYFDRSFEKKLLSVIQPQDTAGDTILATYLDKNLDDVDRQAALETFFSGHGNVLAQVQQLYVEDFEFGLQLKKDESDLSPLFNQPKFERRVSSSVKRLYKGEVREKAQQSWEEAQNLPEDQQQSAWSDYFAQYPELSTKVHERYLKEFTIGRKVMENNPTLLKTFYREDSFSDHLAQATEDQFAEVVLTGTSVVLLEGTNYLVRNLFISLSIAICIVALIMAAFFSSFRMILVSLITNLIPLLLTAAMMGFFGITIKPSTILVFSIAFGISVDDTIHFLAKYRQELKAHNWNIGPSVIAALKETGVSMMYTSIILFFGFSVFDSSEFGGTMALGILVSFTLLVAMLANLVLLPSFLLTMNKSMTTKAFEEPFMEILDEEEDIELDDLTVKKTIGNGLATGDDSVLDKPEDSSINN